MQIKLNVGDIGALDEHAQDVLWSYVNAKIEFHRRFMEGIVSPSALVLAAVIFIACYHWVVPMLRPESNAPITTLVYQLMPWMMLVVIVICVAMAGICMYRHSPEKILSVFKIMTFCKTNLLQQYHLNVSDIGSDLLFEGLIKARRKS